MNLKSKFVFTNGYHK